MIASIPWLQSDLDFFLKQIYLNKMSAFLEHSLNISNPLIFALNPKKKTAIFLICEFTVRKKRSEAHKLQDRLTDAFMFTRLWHSKQMSVTLTFK